MNTAKRPRIALCGGLSGEQAYAQRILHSAVQGGDCHDDGSESSSSDRSSDNEYAEGLGCAGMKNFGGGGPSGYEFENHDREEFFEQPKSYGGSREDLSSFAQVPQPLSKLEALEEQGIAADIEQAKKRQHIEQLLQRRNVKRQLAKECRSAQPNLDTRAPRRKLIEEQLSCQITAADLKDYRDSLVKLRNGATGIVQTQSFLAILLVLETLSVATETLKSSGIGMEVNNVFWRQNYDADVATRSRSLVAKWRAVVRAEKNGA